ncbi:MAG: peptide ABC transporter substrate-binding protein, partial [Coriobacteriia bacterium]|nr:peptide ABC transporter substrate-binding protein [Coriobacteriia bacterium]
KSGGFATMGIDYYDLGMKAAEMAVEILRGADPATMPVQTVPGDEITINQEVLIQLGIDIPERFQVYVQEVEAPE